MKLPCIVVGVCVCVCVVISNVLLDILDKQVK